ncbi:sigma-70 family RNA polymerase sigma factor [soil metagenome]
MSDDEDATTDAAHVVASVVADELARLVAGLIRVTGDWDLAEDCVQDAVETALSRWRVDGLPRNPAAWRTTVARNRALDVLRRRATERSKLQEAALMDDRPGHDEDPFSDDLLRLVFTCCHPALALDNRVALTLRTVAGLSTAEIARAFLVPEATLSQRLLRTRRKIEHAGIPYRVPPPELLAERTSGVLAVVYLVFNEGYSRRDDALIREALRLARLLVALMPDEDEARGLLALVTFAAARRSTRFDVHGELVPMEEQDRSRWDRTLVDEGLWHLRRAASDGRPPGPYRLQAGIAACHATATEADATDWAAVVELYDGLLVAQRSPVVALNRAIAIGFRDGYAVGLSELAGLDDPALTSYYLVPAARADFLRRLGRTGEALAAYAAALDLVPPDGAEARMLLRRVGELGGS